MSTKLSARERCSNHLEREAVARCPECKRYLCRECATEHQGRIICSVCMARGRGDRKAGVKAFPRWPARMLAAALSFFAAWFFFYLAGYYLVSAPASFHKQTIWSSDADNSSSFEEDE